MITNNLAWVSKITHWNHQQHYIEHESVSFSTIVGTKKLKALIQCQRRPRKPYILNFKYINILAMWSQGIMEGPF